MITAKMMGNLGNQLFIYAFARAMQLECQDELLIDLSGLKRYYYTADYKMNHFDIPKNILYDKKNLKFFSRFKYNFSSKLFHLEQYALKKLKKGKKAPDSFTKKWLRRGCYYYTSRSFYQFPVVNKKNKYIYGYFQAEDYFKKYEDVLRKELVVVDKKSEYDEAIIEKMKNSNSVGISIRINRAPENPKVKDNLALGIIKEDFYYKGMKEIASQVDNPSFFVFSDDIDMVKKTYNFPYPVTYVTPDSAVAGLRLLYSCKHFIITNSTFAWWGAYLGNYENKIVIMPTPWDKTGESRECIYFKDAIKLDVDFETE